MIYERVWREARKGRIDMNYIEQIILKKIVFFIQDSPRE